MLNMSSTARILGVFGLIWLALNSAHKGRKYFGAQWNPSAHKGTAKWQNKPKRSTKLESCMISSQYWTRLVTQSAFTAPCSRIYLSGQLMLSGCLQKSYVLEGFFCTNNLTAWRGAYHRICYNVLCLGC